jgi:acid phosphatase
LLSRFTARCVLTQPRRANIYLPPIAARVNKLLNGLTFTTDDITNIAYLCGFETQITGKTSPWCGILQKKEIEQYEYAQDIRYYYGTGPGSDLEKQLMLPFLTQLVQRFVDVSSSYLLLVPRGFANNTTF